MKNWLPESAVEDKHTRICFEFRRAMAFANHALDHGKDTYSIYLAMQQLMASMDGPIARDYEPKPVDGTITRL